MIRISALLLTVNLVATHLAAEDEKFVAHEWGVMVRSTVLEKPGSGEGFRHVARAGEEGEKGKQRGVLAAPQELLGQLPPFVIRHASAYAPRSESRAWNKPVIHLYGKEGLPVEIKILTPHGRPLAYWPKPKLLEETFWFMGSGTTDAVGMQWSGALTKQPKNHLAEAKAGHWWQNAREVPGMYLNMDGSSERFVFYEATAYQEPVVTGAVIADAVEIKNAYAAPSGPVLVIVNTGTKRGWAKIEDVPAKGSVKVSKEDLFKADAGEAKLLEACRAQWEALGMTKEEARAIVEIWKPDLLDSKGFLLVSKMPGPLFDGMFPLEIAPKPDALVRAGVVFDSLPGEAARIGWMPELQKEMEAWGKDLASEEFEVREKATQAFRKTGDLAQPVLEKLAQAEDLNISGVAKRLLEGLKPAPVNALPTHFGRGSESKLIKDGAR